jgi:hypothetical protein
MSEMAPLDAGFDLSIRGFGQASGGARARRGVTAASQTQRRGRAGGDGGHFLMAFADFVAVASAISATGPAVSDRDIFGSRIDGPSSARR